MSVTQQLAERQLLLPTLHALNHVRSQPDSRACYQVMHAAWTAVAQWLPPVRASEYAAWNHAAALEELNEAFERALSWPCQRLAVYGTLAPGEKNHRVVAAVRDSSWTPATIRGHRREGPGYPYFRWNVAGPEIAAQILESPELPLHWPRIDAFEGDEYRRIFVTAETSHGVVVANLYEAVDSLA